MNETPDDVPPVAAAPLPELPLPLPTGDGSAAQATIRSSVAIKLATTMFLHHVALGTWIVTLGSYINANSGGLGKDLFTAGFVGVIYGAGPLGGMVSPFITGVLADRFFATERIMAVLNLLCAAALFAAISAASQAAFYVAVLCYFLCYLPSFSLATSMAMHHLENPAKQFPIVRACGTMGWIAGGLIVGWFWPLATGDRIEHTATPMRIAVWAELATAAFCLWLPHTPPTGRGPLGGSALAGPALGALLTSPRFLALLGLAAAAHIPSQFYYAYSNVFFNWTNMAGAAAKMTLGQALEVGVMLMLPMLLMRLNIKGAILVGLAAWAVRFAMLAVATSPDAPARTALLYAAILLHGVAFTLVTISLQLEVDRYAGPRQRATAQGLLSVAVQGLGCFLGAELAGAFGAILLPASAGTASVAGWQQFWTIPACGAALAWVLAALILPRDSPDRRA